MFNFSRSCHSIYVWISSLETLDLPTFKTLALVYWFHLNLISSDGNEFILT